MRDDEPPHVYVLVNGVIKTSRRGAEVLMEQIYANGHEVAYDHAAKQFLSSALRGLPVEIVEEQELMRPHQGSSPPFVVGSVCHEMDWKSTTPVGHDVLMREALSQIFLRISPPVLDDELDHLSRIVQRRVLVSEDVRIMQRMIDAIGRDMYEKIEPRLDRSEHRDQRDVMLGRPQHVPAPRTRVTPTPVRTGNREAARRAKRMESKR